MTERLLPNSIRTSLANGEYMERGWLARVVPGLPANQQTSLFRGTIKRLLVKARQHRRQGSRMGLQRRTILALVRDAQQLYRQLQLRGAVSIDASILKRARNPFTGVSHSSLEEEIQQTEHWRVIESSHYQQITERLRSGTALDAFSKHTLKQQCKVSGLKLFNAKDYLKGLRLERTSVPSVGSKTEIENRQAGYKKTCRPAKGVSNVANLPYTAQHYMLGDIYDRFKRAFFVFGRREIRELMQKKGWYDPEGLSIKEFEYLMDQDEHWHDIHQIFKDKFESIRLIRNAYAHESHEMNMGHLEELLIDAKVIARILANPPLLSLLDKYEELLAAYSKRDLELGGPVREKFRHELIAAKKFRDASLKRLVSSRRKRLTRPVDLRAEKLRIHRRFDNLKAKLETDYRSFELILVKELKEFSLASSIRYRLDLRSSEWAASLVQILSEEYATTKNKLETLQDTSIQGESRDMPSAVKFSNVSKIGPRTSQADKAIPPPRPAIGILEKSFLEHRPSSARNYPWKGFDRASVPTKQHNLNRKSQGKTISPTGQAESKAQLPFDKLTVGMQSGNDGQLQQVRDDDKNIKSLSRPKDAVDTFATKAISEDSKALRMQSHENIVRRIQSPPSLRIVRRHS
jgi:hypothetical protein